MAFFPKKTDYSDEGFAHKKPNLTAAQAWEKIKPYCAYQERYQQEVRDKLYDYGLNRQEVETMLSRLIEENYLNEERFAIQYAGGHFRIKKWGRVKIKAGLKQKFISEYCIKKALRQIDEDDYLAVLEKLAAAKWEALRGQQYLARQAKCRNYLLQKGFEAGLVLEAIKKLVKGED